MEKLPGAYTPMGITAENVANRFGITRAAAGRVRATEPAEGEGRAREGRVRGRDRARCARVALRRTASASTRTSRVDELPRPDTTLEGLAQAAARVRAGRQRHRRQQLAALRRRRRGARDDARARPTSSASSRSATSARSSRSASIRRSWASARCPAVQKLLAKTGLDDRRHRPVRDQRGVREPGGVLPARARHPRREAQRQRRRDRARPPARLHRREAHRDARSTSCAAAAAATRSSRCASAAARARPACSNAPDSPSMWASRSSLALRSRDGRDRGVAAARGCEGASRRAARSCRCCSARSRRAWPRSAGSPGRGGGPYIAAWDHWVAFVLLAADRRQDARRGVARWHDDRRGPSRDSALHLRRLAIRDQHRCRGGGNHVAVCAGCTVDRARADRRRSTMVLSAIGYVAGRAAGRRLGSGSRSSADSC